MKLFLKGWFVTATIVFTLAGVAGCASVAEPRFIQRNFLIEAPNDLVWDGAIHYLSSENIPISRMEKDRGIIYAERTFQSSITDDEYADCPEGHMLRNRRTKFNIFIRETATEATRLRVRLQFQREYTAASIHGENLGTKFYDCASTGVGEREIYEKILDYVSFRTDLPDVAQIQGEILNTD